MAGTEISPPTMIFGWIVLLILGALIGMLPILAGAFVIYCGYLFISGCMREITPDTVPETSYQDIPTFNFDDIPTVPDKPSVPQEDIDDAISALSNLGYKNKGDLRATVDLAIEQGASTLEEILRNSLQLLYHR